MPVLGQRDGRDRGDVLGRHIAHDSFAARPYDLIPIADAVGKRFTHLSPSEKFCMNAPGRRMVYSNRTIRQPVRCSAGGTRERALRPRLNTETEAL
jgi:hypothetical protein